jgi:hypothetical protein
MKLLPCGENGGTATTTAAATYTFQSVGARVRPIRLRFILAQFDLLFARTSCS